MVETLKKGFIYSGLICFVFAIIGWFFFAIVFKLDDGHVLGLLVGLLVGLLGGLYAGLGDVLKHLALRGLLWRAGVAPRRYDKFLFYAKDRRLMRQVGGGFIFLHRYLLEYFADWYERKYMSLR